MAFVIPPGFSHAAIEMRMTGDPDPWYCTLGVDNNGATDGKLIANHIFNAWKVSFLEIMPSVLSLTGVIVKVGQDGGVPVLGYSDRDASPGLKATSFTFLPQNCALLVDKLSALGGRRNRGRFYIPGILLESDVSNVGVIANVTPYQDEATIFDNTLRASATGTPVFGTTGLDPVILHHDQGTPPVVPTPITSFRVQNTISTQRKRLR